MIELLSDDRSGDSGFISSADSKALFSFAAQVEENGAVVTAGVGSGFCGCTAGRISGDEDRVVLPDVG